MKWPGLKLASKNFRGWMREAREGAEDNIVMSNPPPNPKEIQRCIARAMKAIVDLESSVIRMLTGKGKKRP